MNANIPVSNSKYLVAILTYSTLNRNPNVLISFCLNLLKFCLCVLRLTGFIFPLVCYINILGFKLLIASSDQLSLYNFFSSIFFSFVQIQL